MRAAACYHPRTRGVPVYAIDNILTLTTTTSEARAPATGLNTAAFVSGDADASLQGKLYVDAATVDDDVTATDLTAQAGVQIKAILAGGPRVGGVYLLVYDDATEDPSDALAAGVAAGIRPRWSYTHVVIQERADATIAFASTWAHTNARGDALVWGQEDAASILSGTVPAGIAATSGADLTLVVYDDQDTSPSVETFVGWILSYNMDESRPGYGHMRPPGLIAYTTELTDAQLPLVTGRDSGQARCIAHQPLFPADPRRIGLYGYTIGGTLGEVEQGVIYIRATIYSRWATFVATRAELQRPLRTNAEGKTAADAVLSQALSDAAGAGYIETGVAADIATDRPALPNGFVFTSTFVGTTYTATGWVAYPGDVRRFSISLTGAVT